MSAMIILTELYAQEVTLLVCRRGTVFVLLPSLPVKQLSFLYQCVSPSVVLINYFYFLQFIITGCCNPAACLRGLGGTDKKSLVLAVLCLPSL